MIRTENYIRTLADKGLVDDAVAVENGYDIQYRGNIVSVRFNDKGGALIYNQKKNTVTEIQSGRLDEVLHRYIIQSLFGLQTKTGIRNNLYKDVFLVPTKVISNALIFEDPCGRKFSVKGSSPHAVLSYYDEACTVNADDALILLSNFNVHSIRDPENITSNVEREVEMTLLKSDVNLDDYSVAPRSECINNVGQTIVGNFCCSSADKINMVNFEYNQARVFGFGSAPRKNITSSTIRTKNPYAAKAKAIVSSPKIEKLVSNHLNDKYPYGLCVSAMEQMLAYETPAILSANRVEIGNFEYKDEYAKALKNATSVQFRLDSNKSIVSAVCCEGKSVAKFRAVPNLAEIRNGLQKEGYLLTELENGLEFGIDDPAINCIICNCKNYVPVSEKPVNMANTVSRIIGSNCKNVLVEYGINDVKGVFSSITQIVVN